MVGRGRVGRCEYLGGSWWRGLYRWVEGEKGSVVAGQQSSQRAGVSDWADGSWTCRETQAGQREASYGMQQYMRGEILRYILDTWAVVVGCLGGPSAIASGGTCCGN